jgi:drug/metabolite transporter (DMT)-like permease
MDLNLSPNIAGSLFMAISMAGFTLNDTIVKFVATDMNMGQVMLVRGVFATLFIVALAYHQGALPMWRMVFHPTVAARAVCELFATITFLLALTHMPIANVSAILQALPLAVTMGAAMFFGEPVGWRRWLSIAVGFAGVMVVVRPGMEGFSPFALMVLLCVLFCAVRDLVTRRMPPEIPSTLASVATAGVVALCGGVLIVPLGGWTPMSGDAFGLLAAAALLVVIGYQFIIMAMRVGDISFIAPFRYTALLWAILLGFLVFGDVPDLAMIVGAAIIVASGLYMLYRERIVNARRPVAGSTSPGMAPDGL